MNFITGPSANLDAAWKHASSQSTNSSPVSSAVNDQSLDSAWQDQPKKTAKTREERVYNQVKNDLDLKIAFTDASNWLKSAL